ncbi:putative immunity protein [Streptomyces longwoodensis]|uniref:putative immunity protein n=1 Tax=Streptomyces longwoodensis TaxID=68231 RepID=UPI00370316C5
MRSVGRLTPVRVIAFGEDEFETEDASEIVLSMRDLREVAAFAAACAETVLDVFEADRPDDPRPREAVGAAWEFALSGERGKALRTTALAALKAAADAGTVATREAAWAAMSAAGSAYLHPLARSTQVKHILGAGAYAARAVELVAGDDRAVGTESLVRTVLRATPAVVGVLKRFPAAPGGGGRGGELIRILDVELRALPPGT